MRKIFSSMLLLCGALLQIPVITAAQQTGRNSRTNIVLIFMDDMGYGDLRANGALGYLTPNIDKLVAEGMRFTNFYAAQPICTASRAGLLTGCYPNRIGLVDALGPNAKIGISDKEVTIAGMLKNSGYATGMVGKWHLGAAEKFLPLQHGFDEYFGLPYSNDMWPVDYEGNPVTDSAKGRSKNPVLPLIEGNKTYRLLRTLDDQSDLTTQYTERAVSFINRNKKTPFFLYFAHTMVHVPLAVSAKFKGKSQLGLFGDVMMEVDWSVGEIMKTLRVNGLDNNTLVIFTSDNGPWLTFGNHAGSSGGLRDGKMTTYEGGQKEPTVMRWPGVIKPGTFCNQLASTIDLLPTFAAITGSQLPANKIDGVNILSLLKGDVTANPRNQFYYYFDENSLEAVREGNWKLILPHQVWTSENEVPGKDGRPGKYRIDTAKLALYDLRRDPGERNDVKEQQPAVVARLLQIAEQAREDLGDDLTGRPGKNRRPVGRL
jgi:arylsulfatase A-like enzyme